MTPVAAMLLSIPLPFTNPPCGKTLDFRTVLKRDEGLKSNMFGPSPDIAIPTDDGTIALEQDDVMAAAAILTSPLAQV